MPLDTAACAGLVTDETCWVKCSFGYEGATDSIGGPPAGTKLSARINWIQGQRIQTHFMGDEVQELVVKRTRRISKHVCAVSVRFLCIESKTLRSMGSLSRAQVRNGILSGK